MNEFWNKNNRAILIIVTIIFTVVGFFIFYGGFNKVKLTILGGERVISETPISRAIEGASTVDGRFATSSGENIRLVGQEKVTIKNGKTLKESYALANPEAITLASDAKLVYIKSLGTVTVDGASSGWEIVFGSKLQKKGYVFTVVSGNIIDKKEITSTSFGYALPNNWYDAGEAIKSIQTLPQFSSATISGMNFYYNEDGKRWGYSISSSNGTVSVPVQ